MPACCRWEINPPRKCIRVAASFRCTAVRGGHIRHRPHRRCGARALSNHPLLHPFPRPNRSASERVVPKPGWFRITLRRGVEAAGHLGADALRGASDQRICVTNPGNAHAGGDRSRAAAAFNRKENEKIPHPTTGKVPSPTSNRWKTLATSTARLPVGGGTIWLCDPATAHNGKTRVYAAASTFLFRSHFRRTGL